MNQSKKLTDGALLLAIYIVLLLITIFVPIVTIFGMFLLPIPFILYAARHGLKPSFLMFVASLLITALIATIAFLPFTVLAGIGGIAIGAAIHKEVSAYETLARGTLGFIIGLLFIFAFSQVVFSVNLVNELKVIITDSMDMSASIMEQFGASGQTEQMEELLLQQVNMLIELLPVGLALTAIVLAFLSQWISYKFINRLEKKQLRFPPFRNLRFPTSILWIYFFALFISFFDLNPAGIYYTAVHNLLALTGLLMALQGFSFVFLYTYHKKITKAVPIFIVVITLLFPTFLLYFVRILGIIDIGFRLRERLTSKK